MILLATPPRVSFFCSDFNISTVRKFLAEPFSSEMKLVVRLVHQMVKGLTPKFVSRIESRITHDKIPK